MQKTYKFVQKSPTKKLKKDILKHAEVPGRVFETKEKRRQDSLKNKKIR